MVPRYSSIPIAVLGTLLTWNAVSLMAESGSLASIIELHVPTTARVYINDQPTRTTGSLRRYRSSGLQPGFQYAYRVRAELIRDGRTIEQSKVVHVQAGQTIRISFDFADAATPTLPSPVVESTPRVTRKEPAPVPDSRQHTVRPTLSP